MATTNVKEKKQGTFLVTVKAGNTTQHEVNVDSAYAKKLTEGRISNVDLVKKSFEFFLKREPNASILRRFDLSVISSYFPEFESIIRQ